MKKIIRSLFWRSDDDRFSFDDGRKSSFRLLYGNLLIGELSFFDGKWHFSYSADFIKDSKRCTVAELNRVKGFGRFIKEIWTTYNHKLICSQSSINSNAPHTRGILRISTSWPAQTGHLSYTVILQKLRTNPA